MSESLSSLFTKERPYEQSALIAVSDFLFRSQKTSDSLEKFVFFVCFWQFFTAFPLFMPKSYRSPRSLQKSDSEGFALFQVQMASSLFRSQKRAIRSKNQGANSYAWIFLFLFKLIDKW